MGWPALVVGHRGTGKSSIIRGLAAAVGARLTEVAMTPSVDVTELLGCYEQVQTYHRPPTVLVRIIRVRVPYCVRVFLSQCQSNV